jgi:hypothetical protein
VKTDNKDVLATAYARVGKALAALASWARDDVDIRLSIDWKLLGLHPAKAILTAPEVRDLQPSARFKPEDPIPIQKGKGWLLILEPATEVR